MLEHGGRRRAAARRYGIAETEWLDLSTGINPHPYPVPALAPEDWQRLPEDDDGLLDAACACYGARQLVALAGSQPAIQALPTLLPRGRVAVLAPTYGEHPYHWQRAGHALQRFAAEQFHAVAAHPATDTVVLCQPNNPDTAALPPAELLAAARQLATRGGHLIVDEAFVDPTPERSLAGFAGDDLPSLIVLRSLGKFFGLAGARVGFVAARPALLDALTELAGPWPLSGPARRVALAALADQAWQTGMRRTLATASARLAAVLAPLAGATRVRTHPLFCWLPTPHAEALADALARRGILVRLFAQADAQGLRVGLPGREADWQRLAAAVSALAVTALTPDR